MHTVSGSISLPFGVLSPFPHGTGSLSVTREYLALGDGPPRFRTEFHVLRRTQDPLKRGNIFDYRIITFFDSSFQMIRLMSSFVTPYRVSYNPNKQACWFRSSVSLAATKGIEFSLFLQVLRCFSSPGVPSDMLYIHISIT